MKPPFISPALARLVPLSRGLLFQSGHGRAPRQFRLDIAKRHAARFQEHQQVKQQVGAFGNEMAAIILDRGDPWLPRFLAKLLGAMLRALAEQFAGIRRRAARSGADIDGGGQVMDRETRHQLNPGMCARGWDAAHPMELNTSVTKSRQGSSRIGSPARTM